MINIQKIKAFNLSVNAVVVTSDLKAPTRLCLGDADTNKLTH
ncbi:hypothetical protein OAT67_02405 [Bacteriovoracaceae bacterium]|nr:hypothetical protein [Bacteriovoracaceae bacterium]